MRFATAHLCDAKSRKDGLRAFPVFPIAQRVRLTSGRLQKQEIRVCERLSKTLRKPSGVGGTAKEASWNARA